MPAVKNKHFYISKTKKKKHYIDLQGLHASSKCNHVSNFRIVRNNWPSIYFQMAHVLHSIVRVNFITVFRHLKVGRRYL